MERREWRVEDGEERVESGAGERQMMYPDLPSTLYPLKQRSHNVLRRMAIAKVGDLVVCGRRIA